MRNNKDISFSAGILIKMEAFAPLLRLTSESNTDAKRETRNA